MATRAVAAAAMTAVLLPLAATAASAGSAAANLDQCQNGPRTLPVSCTDTTYVNGDANAQQAHWAEGEFVPYRAVLTGLAPGQHTFIFGYSPVRSGKHAFDYIGSYDATETTQSTPTAQHANNNNPCPSAPAIAGCNPSAPTATVAVPAADLGNTSSPSTTICGVPGTFSGKQVPGTVDLFGAVATSGVSLTYYDQNVVHHDKTSGTFCNTDLELLFTVPAGTYGTSGATVLVTWGGHIATGADWGIGNSATSIHGSPYHMFLDSLDGSPTSQDHQLDASAVYALPGLTTAVQPGVSVDLGTPVNDTATLADASYAAGGTVTYTLYPGATCTGTPVTTPVAVAVMNGVVPHSPTFNPTAAGSYSYLASYSGDTNDAAATAACEPFTVTPVAPGFTTAPATSTIVYGGTLSDTATLTGIPAGGAPVGTVSFGLCQETTVGTPCTSGGATVATAQSSPNASTDTLTVLSDAAKPTGVGTWCFYASYSAAANGNYTSVALESNQPAECFTVTPAGTRSSTKVADASVQLTPAGTISGTISDTVTVTDQSAGGGSPTGTVKFYVCQTGTSATVPADSYCDPSLGILVDSTAALTPGTDGISSTGTSSQYHPPSTGTYCFSALYSGDTNFAPSEDNTSAVTIDVPAECVVVTQAASATSTTLQGVTGAITGASVGDKATVTGISGVTETTPTGQVHFVLFSDPSAALSSASACSAQTGATVFPTVFPAIANAVDLSSNGSVSVSGVGPLPAGNYGFEATYLGDGQYLGSVGNCEPFTVAPATPTVSTTPQGAAGAVTGATVSDLASVTTTVAGFSPAGSVDFTLYKDTTGQLSDTTTCSAQSGAAVYSGPDNQMLVGSTAGPQPFGPLPAGNYGFEAQFVPAAEDGNFTPATGVCEPFVVGPATPLVQTVPANVDGAVTGQTVTDTATVTSPVTVASPQGSVTFTLYNSTTALGAGSSCADQGATALATGKPVTLSNGSATSGSFGPLAAGSYGFGAVYTSSDGNFTTAYGLCEPFTVQPAPTDTTTAVVPSSGASTGAQVHDTASVLPTGGPFPVDAPELAPTGSVTFTLYKSTSALSSTVACTGTQQSQEVVSIKTDGTAASTPVTVGAGFYGYQVSYSGDSNYAPSADTCEPFSVGMPTTVTTTQVQSGDQAPAPATSVDQATVSTTGGFTLPPTGSVTFTLYSAPNVLTGASACDGQTGATVYSTQPSPAAVPVSNTGVATSPSVTGLPAGFYGWQASYAGDPNYGSSTGDCEPFQVLVPPTITATKYDATPGDGVAVNPYDPSHDTIAYQIVVSNSGQMDATDVTVTDPIPTGTTVTAVGTYGTSGATNVTFTGFTVPAGGTTTLTFTVLVSTSDAQGLVIPNTATFTVPEGSIDLLYPPEGGSCGVGIPSCTTNTVTNPVQFPVVSAEKTSNPADGSVVSPDESIGYTITLTNSGPVDATGVSVTDAVPAETTFVSASTGGLESGGTITWSGLTVPAGGTTAVSFTVTVDAVGVVSNGDPITNQAQYSTVDTPGCDNGQTCTTNKVTQTVEYPVIGAVKSSDPASGSQVQPGSKVTYTIAVSNTGGASATGVVVTDKVPTGTTFVSAGQGGTVTGSAGPATVSWTVASLAAGASTDVTFVVSVDATNTSEQIPNTADFTDVNTSGCSATTCPTNTVTVFVPAPQSPATSTTTTTTTTTTVPAPTTTAPPQHSALAFTGMNATRLALIGLFGLGTGFLLVASSRRRRARS